MSKLNIENRFIRQSRSGIALLVTLIILVVLSAMAYALSAKVTAQRRRNQYLIDYQSARYGCDSAVRIAISRLEDLDANLISRPNDPDFSDVFHYTQQQYSDYLAQWAIERELNGLGTNNRKNLVEDLFEFSDVNETDEQEKDIEIPGPYGPPWPLAREVEDLDIGNAKVKIEIEDENAKYPLGWALLDDKTVEREAEVAFETFFQWWAVDDVNGFQARIYNLQDQLEQMRKIKTFEVIFKDKQIVKRMATAPSRGARRPVYRGIRTANRRITVTKAEQISEQYVTFAKLFHSSIIDVEALARPIIVSDSRSESFLKYMGIWGSKAVNINTAPRNVLESAFTFGGYPEKIADEIILRRKIQPFESVEQLKQSLFGYSDSIDKCKDYITTSSTYFTLKITSTCGLAKVTMVVAVTKTGKNVKTIALISS